MSDAAQRFVHDLNQLRQRAGQPSYSTLERLSKHQLKRATVSDVLNFNRLKVPDWRFVAEFVAACRAAAEESGLDPNELGTLAEWKRHWDGASAGVIDARVPGHSHQALARQAQNAVPPPEVPAESARVGPAISGPLPSRLPDFVGREAWLEDLREALAREDRADVVAIQGMFGVGKTQLVLEFAYRSAGDYDLVWWVPCGDAESAHAAMADLAAALGLADIQAAEQASYTELFDVLRRGQRYGRWLLVFDNAGEPEEIRKLIPPTNGSGHVLVTTRSSRWEASGDLIELDVFPRTESIEFLRRRMRRFSVGSADRLAEGVGDLPLLLEHAAESNAGLSSYLSRLESDPLGLLDEQPADYHATIAGEWRTALTRLRDEAPDALDLLRCLAFFGNDTVPRESLERGSYLPEISIHAMLGDPFRRLGAIRKLRRAGLLRVRPGDGSFDVHRVARYVVRDMVARSGSAAEERARRDVHLLLAAADPLAPDDPSTWPYYGELCGHAAAAGIAAARQEIVRKFAVNLVRFLNASGDPRAALEMADSVLGRWAADDVAASGRPADSQVVMQVGKADALFACGRYAEAAELRQRALAVMHLDGRRWAAEIVQLRGMSSAGLRVIGEFKAAQSADEESAVAHARVFGDDDPRTFTAVNSLITDLALNGEVAEATSTAARLHRNCLKFYSDVGHFAVLANRNVYGRCLWQSGKYGEAVDVLAEVHAGYAALADSGVLDENHPWRLVHEIDYAAARRDKGLLTTDSQPLAVGMHAVRRRSWRLLGADHPLTLAASVVLASLLRRSSGQTAEAVRMLADAERRYQSTLPGHPYAHVCAGFHAALRCQAANGDPQHDLVPAIQAAAGRLAETVGTEHPLFLVVMSMEANALARTGELDAALKRALEALAGFQSLPGGDHPHALALEANTVTIQARLGNEPKTADLLASYAAAVGSGHPDVALFGQGQLIDIDFTPLPL